MKLSTRELIKKFLNFAKEEEIVYVEQLISDLSLIRQFILLENYKVKRHNLVYLIVIFLAFLIIVGFSAGIEEGKYFGLSAVILFVVFILIGISMIKKINYRNHIDFLESFHEQLKSGLIFEDEFNMIIDKQDNPTSINMFYYKKEPASLVFDDNGITITRESGKKYVIGYQEVKSYVYTPTRRQSSVYEIAILLKDGRKFGFLEEMDRFTELLHVITALQKAINMKMTQYF